MKDDPETHVIDGVTYVKLSTYVGREIELLRKLEKAWKKEKFVLGKIRDYVASGFDPSMMGPTLDDIRRELVPDEVAQIQSPKDGS